MTTRTLVGFPTYAADATFAMITGSAEADYPVSALGDLKKIRRVFRATASGAIAFKATFPAVRSLELLTLLHHNGVDGATYRFRCYSDASLTTLIDDSGTLTIDLGADPQFRLVTPYALPSAMNVRAVRVDLSDIGTAWQIGGFDMAQAWTLEEASRREIGIKPQDQLDQMTDGVVHATRQFSPRVIISGGRYRAYSDDGYTLLDLGKLMGRSEPFVFVRAYDEAGTWEREALLVRLRSMPSLTRHAGPLASFDLPLQEHLR